MSANEILAMLQACDVTLAVSEPDGLLIDGPQDALTDDLIEAIRANKSELRTFLMCDGAAEPEGPQSPTLRPDPAEMVPAVGDRCYLLAPDGSTHNITEAWTVAALQETADGKLAKFADRPYREWPLKLCRKAMQSKRGS